MHNAYNTFLALVTMVQISAYSKKTFTFTQGKNMIQIIFDFVENLSLDFTRIN